MSDGIVCERCPTPLSGRQKRFCSPACYDAARALPRRSCAGCGRSFRGDRRVQRFCSARCVQQHQGRPQRQRLLALLQATRHRAYPWLTMSDLSIWLYGDDGAWEVGAVKTLLYRLRRDDGYEIVSRLAPWDARPFGGPARAYRLLDVAREAAA